MNKFRGWPLLVLFFPLAHLFFKAILGTFEFFSSPQSESFFSSSFSTEIAPAFFTTFKWSFVAVCIVAPLGVALGLVISEFPMKKRAKLALFLVDVLAGVPPLVSVAFLWLLANSFGATYGEFAAVVCLVMLLLPRFVRRSVMAHRRVPNEVREAVLALGVPSYRVALLVVARRSFPRVVVSMFLALVSALGETAPLLFLMSPNVVKNIFLLSNAEHQETLWVYVLFFLIAMTGLHFVSALILSVFARQLNQEKRYLHG